MHKTTGFTLIELLIAIALLSILATVAVPSYQSYIARGARAQARATLLDIAQSQERYFSNNNTYLAITTSTTPPAGFSNYAGDSQTKRKYDITVSAASGSTLASSFVISATPANGFSDSDCGTLTLDNTGTKTSSAGTVANCWK